VVDAGGDLKKLAVGVIGVGYLGQHHARIYSNIDSVDLVGVCDTSEEQGRKIASHYDTKYYTDRNELLEHVDAVSVAVPTPLHHEVSKDVMAQGKHLLLEKPIAEKLAQADELIQISKDRGVVFQIGHIERFNPAVIASLKYINHPLFIESHRLSPFKNRGVDVPVIYDLMVHDIDIVLSLVKSPVKRIEAVGVPVLSKEFDIANARIEFENGTIANFTTSRVSKEKMRKIRFFQTDSYISINYLDHSVEYYKRIFKDKQPFIERKELNVPEGEPLKLEIESFIASVSDGTEPKVTAEDAKEALLVANKMVKKIMERQGEINKLINDSNQH
jgi:predicted dehydrogenase